MINDISAGADPGMFELAAKMNTPIVLMHMKGTPENMQKSPVYENVVDEVLEFLLERADRAIKAGVDRKLIIIDPGIGFGKTLEHNLLLLRNLDRFVGAGFAVLVGASRKGFIGELTGRRIAAQRAAGTIATSIAAQNAGVGIVRVHDVADNLDALKVAAMIQTGE
jgi:dihydropteroate synthase